VRILFSAAYSAIEPLGLLHLAGLARDMGWGRKISLVKDHDFTTLYEDIADFKPDLVGFNIYTGNHLQTFVAIDHIKEYYPSISILVGGPHATYFPIMAASHADYVVMSEGFYSLQQILSGDAEKGIMPFSTTQKFPLPDRYTLYGQYPEYATSPIKSMIGMTGCPYACTYCYNSSTPSDIKVTPELAQKIADGLSAGGRLFPFNIRSVDDLVKEGKELEKWPTEIVAFQDDVHGFDTKKWLPDMVARWKPEVGLPYHSQMRWEMVNGDGGKRRLDLVREAGGTALTLAIESADVHIRKEVLDRGMSEDLMFNGMYEVKQRDMKVRTEQITALPYGATTERTPVNLEADIALIKLNNDLEPDIAWASTYAPYAGTKLGQYAVRYGHYNEPSNYDVPDSFFDKSILRFPKEWVGPDLNGGDESLWLHGDELEKYRLQNAALRKHFNLLCLIPNGHILARQFLTDGGDLSSDDLCGRIKYHLYDEVLYKP